MKKAIIFFCLTGIFWALSLFFGIRFVKSILEASNADLAKVEAPGSVIFPIETAGSLGGNQLADNQRGNLNGEPSVRDEVGGCLVEGKGEEQPDDQRRRDPEALLGARHATALLGGSHRHLWDIDLCL